MSSIPACHLSCLNGGYCNYISTDETTLIDTFARGGLIQKCICPPGYGGISCENKIEQCSNDLTCHNGVPCALNERGEYYCDCSYGDLISTFAGKMCREPATSYCGQGDIKNRSFCTNGGLCQSNIYRGVHFDESSEYSTHKGCACPPEFEGDHCEFLKVQSEEVQAEQVQAEEDQAEVDQEEEVQEEEDQAEKEQAEQVQAEEEQAEEVQSEEVQAEEDQAEDQAEVDQEEKVQAEEVQAEKEQSEQVQAEEDQAEEVQAEESTDQHDTEETALAAPATSTVAEPVAPLNHAKESNESNELNLPEEDENVQVEAPPRHEKTPPIQDQPFSKAPPVQDLPSSDNAPPVPDNTLLDLESASIETIAPSSKGSSEETNQLEGSTIALISLIVAALMIGLLSYRRMRKRGHRELENHFVLGDNYKDETPIRVQMLSELEQPNELDEVLGLDAGSVEYEDDDELLTERSECSLEEIELEYPTVEGEEEGDEFEEPIHQSDRNPFAHIIGPLMRSGDGIV